ncbi:MAG: GTPase Era [Candidatus Azobacteroides pseudotrichonymphae]|jgi:GTP-binding protein Era|uniref:GTPase Era n=1 Tax=Azobacteroides pseudotrichonymphae genomovar. CFP2 TaxID=511995 RepID=B6YQY7_AZOPC|nr:GTP-binding protein Era [Candidatus Azobacteroides pseudotrichonymphae genomovar. CFP2]GMO32354.1 MAG: GTPase Era [Candidatus Azobacteroides pseudotrichonymphae]
MHSDIENKHKSGFVNIVGNPNVGKSTLMNTLVGGKLSIITSKAQTTRHRIIGIVNKPNVQIVFSDTPGILRPNYKLQKKMLNFSESALEDADILLYVSDIKNQLVKTDFFLKKMQQTNLPILLILNKIDLFNQKQLEQKVIEYHKILPNAEIIPISAINQFNTDYLQKRIEKLLPESPPYFEKNTITDRPARFFSTEIIREKVLLYYQKEIPYSVEVTIELFKEQKDLIWIKAIIITERDSQKKIIIGKDGKALKRIGFTARKDIEKFFDKKIFLEMHVKVEKNWRNRDNLLKRYGYKSE